MSRHDKRIQLFLVHLITCSLTNNGHLERCMAVFVLLHEKERKTSWTVYSWKRDPNIDFINKIVFLLFICNFLEECSIKFLSNICFFHSFFSIPYRRILKVLFVKKVSWRYTQSLEAQFGELNCAISFGLVVFVSVHLIGRSWWLL